jgi:hypothetical protein
LSTTWNFGDGTTGSGAAASHAYTTAGTYTITATVSDGLAQVQSSTVITVTGTGTGGGTPTGARSAGTSTVKSSAYGADFGLTVPSACLRKGTQFSVTLSIRKQRRAKAKGSLLVKVTKVVFAIGGKPLRTVRSAPFRARLAVPPAATSGSTIKLGVKSYLKLTGGRRRTRSITVPLRVC